MMTVYWGLEVAATLLESYLCFKVIHQMLFSTRNTKFEKRCLLMLMIILTAGIIFLNTLKLFSVSTTILAIVFMCISYGLLFRCNVFDVLAVSGFYYLCIHTIDFLSISVLGMVFQNSQFGSMVISGYSICRLIHIVLTKTILVFYYLLIKKIMIKKVNLIARKLLSGIFLGFFLVFYLGTLTFQSVDFNITLNWFLFLMMISALCYTLWTYNKYRLEKEHAEIVGVRNELIVQQYAELLENYKSNATLCHNINNHHLVLSNYIRERNYDEALAYLSEIGESVIEKYDSIWTGNATFDFILNYKKQEAERLNIDYFTNADIVKFEKIENTDVCNIMGNLLDNAIEACKQVKSGGMWIRINVRKINSLVIIKIENSMTGKPVKNKHSLITSKSNKQLHGWGLKSVESTIDKLGGTISYHSGDNTFAVVVALF